MRVIVIIWLLAILGSLASALVLLYRRQLSRTLMVRALTVRVGLSIGLFLLLKLAYAMGWIGSRL
jgi:hypothetical protein